MSESAACHPAERRAVALVCCVWGATFTDFFCRYALPTLLTDENLCGVTGKVDVTLLLYTSAEDLATIERHASFQALMRYATVKHVGIESFPDEIVTQHWIYWQHAAATFRDDYFAFIFLIPDCIFASDSLTRIIAALERHEIVYYTAPQVCREFVIPELERMKNDGDGTLPALSISRAKLLELFVKHINPKHAAAVHHPDFFTTHPEFLIEVERQRLGIVELVGHPLAFRSETATVTGAFNPASSRHDLGFLEVLALGCEFTLKLIQVYHRWPVLGAHPSRYVSLASWSHWFRDPGIPTYADTQAEITVGGEAVFSDRRTPVRNRRVRYANLALRFIEAQYRVFEFAQTTGSPEARRCMALAMCLPGMRRRIAALGQNVTIFLPSSGTISEMLRALQRAGDASAYREFCLMHVVAGHLRLKRDAVFRLTPAPRDGAVRSPRVQLTDSRVPNPKQAAATGKVLSYPYLIDDGVVVYNVELDYGSTANMLRSLGRDARANR